MKRRDFLCVAFAATLTGGLGQMLGGKALVDAFETARLTERLLTVHRDQEGAAVVGDAFLRQLSHRPAMDHIVPELLANLGASKNVVLRASASELRENLRKTTSREFGLGQTIEVEGWLLGKTETWLCGLAALRLA